MEGKSLMISQSNYIPWKGFFDSLCLVDQYIMYDDMQYTRRDWRNRNKLISPAGPKWLTIPVEIAGKEVKEQLIKDTKIADKDWGKKHWGFITSNYRKAPFYKELKDWLQPLFMDNNKEYLSEINELFIREICSFLDIQVEISKSSDYTLVGDRNERLVNLCKDVDANIYYTGSAAKNYMDESLFAKDNIDLRFFDYSGYPEYDQLFEGFSHEVSIIDMILNLGKDSKKYMKYNK